MVNWVYLGCFLMLKLFSSGNVEGGCGHFLQSINNHYSLHFGFDERVARMRCCIGIIQRFLQRLLNDFIFN